jgi:hypothetical protein
VPTLELLDAESLDCGGEGATRECRPRETQATRGAIDLGHQFGLECHLNGPHVDVDSYSNSDKTEGQQPAPGRSARRRGAIIAKHHDTERRDALGRHRIGVPLGQGGMSACGPAEPRGEGILSPCHS